jgi:hypothetical protein
MANSPVDKHLQIVSILKEQSIISGIRDKIDQ